MNWSVEAFNDQLSGLNTTKSFLIINIMRIYINMRTDIIHYLWQYIYIYIYDNKRITIEETY